MTYKLNFNTILSLILVVSCGTYNNLEKRLFSKQVSQLLKSGNILSKNETPEQMLQRVSNLFDIEKKFGTLDNVILKRKQRFQDYVSEKKIIPGSPLLTNAGRENMPLSSCVVIPINLKDFEKDYENTKKTIISYYKLNMGSGFNFTECEDPNKILNILNTLSKTETQTGKYERYIGNMGGLSVYHPKIQEFITAKKNTKMSHFNISIHVDDNFMQKAINGIDYNLSNGDILNAEKILDLISENAHYNGDPGLLYLDRINKDNPVEGRFEYISTPPCAEMGLSRGETCQFSYINIAKFVTVRDNKVTYDYDALVEAVKFTVRMLDDAIECSLQNFPCDISSEINRYKRKIGIGICGLADLLLELDLPYYSEAAQTFARDVLSFINFTSKVYSMELARKRGSCEAMNDANNKYYSNFLENKYSFSTNTVSQNDWIHLGEKISSSKLLRNILTTALPPTGRSSLILEASSSIEPFLSIFDFDGNLSSQIKKIIYQKLSPQKALEIEKKALLLKSFQDLDIPINMKNCLKIARELTPAEHIKMVSALAGVDGVVDEAASKTINLSNDTSVKIIKQIFINSYDLKLKNISVYRERSY